MPSASLVISIMALIVAASGTAVAASKLISGDTLIKKHSLSGNRLRSHTITGKQINLSKLGTVPSAQNAGHAGSADSASNANALGGQPPSAFEVASNTIRTGIVEAGSNQSVTLATFGPFALTLKCIVSGSSAEARVIASSSQPGSEVGGSILPAGNTIADTGPNTSFTTSNASPAPTDFIAPGEGQFWGNIVAAVELPGHTGPCTGMALISKS